MRKRKFKLISTVAAMAMVLGVMGVGVYAATSQSLAITTTVSFTAKDCQVEVKAKVSGKTQASSASTYIDTAKFTKTSASDIVVKDTSATIFKQSSNTTANGANVTGYETLAIGLTDASNGYVPSTEEFYIDFTITNLGTDALYYNITMPTLSSNATIVEYFNTPTNNASTALTAYNSNSKEGYQLTGTSGDNAEDTLRITLTLKKDLATSVSTALLQGMEFNFYNAWGQLEGVQPSTINFYNESAPTTLANPQTSATYKDTLYTVVFDNASSIVAPTYSINSSGGGINNLTAITGASTLISDGTSSTDKTLTVSSDYAGKYLMIFTTRQCDNMDGDVQIICFKYTSSDISKLCSSGTNSYVSSGYYNYICFQIPDSGANLNVTFKLDYYS